MIKNIFTVAPMLVKLLGSMAHNGYGLAMAGHLYSSAGTEVDDCNIADVLFIS
jgi:hypothetical protein